MPISLRGGMVGSETRTPSLLSTDIRDGNLETNPATRTSSLCSGDVPDGNNVPDTINHQSVPPLLARQVTPVTFVNGNGSGTVILSEPDKIHLSRAVAQEDAEQARGTIAVPPTPILGPLRGFHHEDTDLAEYVGQRFGLDGAEDSARSEDQRNSPTITFRVPDYGEELDDTEAENIDDEAAIVSSSVQGGSQRVANALRNARSRAREFFPTTNIVISRRTSMAPSTSGRSRYSVSLQRALGEQTIIARAVNAMRPRSSEDQTPTEDEIVQYDRVDEADPGSSSRQAQRQLNSQTPADDTAVSHSPDIIDRRASEPVMNQSDRDVLPQITRRCLVDASGTLKDGGLQDTESRPKVESPSIPQRA